MTHHTIDEKLDDDSIRDDEKAAVLGGIGGALVGAAAGLMIGPAGAAAGAAIGAVVGAGASGAAVQEVDRHDHDGSQGEDIADEEESDIYRNDHDVRSRSLFNGDDL